MNILMIAPLPPPLNGQSLAAETIYKFLAASNNVLTVNMAKPRPKNYFDKLARYFKVLSFLIQIFIKKNKCELIYLTISESNAGNIKDLFIYLICYSKLNIFVVHMLGGAGMKNILEKKGVLYKLNKFFISKMRSVIVEGKIQENTFSQLIDSEKIHIVPNFAEDFLFLSEDEIRNKFKYTDPLTILYLSNLLYGKGYNELADAYIALDEKFKDKVKIIFVGGFDSDRNQKLFHDKILNHKNLIYYGNFVSGIKKRELYSQSHIFCLPTYYPFEGQPISILEAYATGCSVITTNHSGIPDIFKDKINGNVVEKKSVNSLQLAIELCIENNVQIVETAMFNRNFAYENFRTEVYCTSISSIICA